MRVLKLNHSKAGIVGDVDQVRTMHRERIGPSPPLHLEEGRGAMTAKGRGAPSVNLYEAGILR
jgi:hypothetical protein